MHNRSKLNQSSSSRLLSLRCGLISILAVWVLIAIYSMSSLKHPVEKAQTIKQTERIHTEEILPENIVSFSKPSIVARSIEPIKDEESNYKPETEAESSHIELESVEQENSVEAATTGARSTAFVPWSERDHGPAPTDPALVGSTWPPLDPRQLALRRSDPNDVFPPPLDEKLCLPRGASGGSYDANKQVLDLINVQPDNADGKTIMCIIYTIESNHGAARACRDTWASHCDGFMVMSNAQDDSIPAAHITHEGKEEYNNIWQKVRSIWKYVSTSYGSEFEWFMIGGDDLFIIPSNLRAYLNSEEIRNAAKDNTPLFLGRRFQIPKAQLFNSGGAGYIMNRASLKLLVDNLDNPLCKPHQTVFAEDVNVASCLAKFGVTPYDTRDREESLSTDGRGLRERFHPFTPGQHFTWRPPRKHKPDGSSADWYENYNSPWGVGQGKECCSSKSASFHYVKPNLMPHMYALLYPCRQGGKQ